MDHEPPKISCFASSLSSPLSRKHPWHRPTVHGRQNVKPSRYGVAGTRSHLSPRPPLWLLDDTVDIPQSDERYFSTLKFKKINESETRHSG